MAQAQRKGIASKYTSFCCYFEYFVDFHIMKFEFIWFEQELGAHG